MIPHELKKIKQWSYSYSLEELKRPTHTKYKPNGALSMPAALRRAGDKKHIGFYVTDQDPYVMIDLDHVDNPKNPFEELTVEVASLLQMHNTYSEISPSGKGIRVIFKLPSHKDKEQLEGQTFYIRGADGGKKNGQVNFGKPWMTITMNETPYAIDTVAEIDIATLDEVFDIRYKGVQRSTPDAKPTPVRSEVPPFSEVLRALGGVKLDQNPRIVRAYEKIFKHKYQHYDFWLRVLMGMHNYGQLTNKSIECLEASIDWSRADDDTFKSEEDVAKHWRSFNEKDTQVSYKSVFGLYYMSNLKWPVPRKQSKTDVDKNRPPLPLNSEYANFDAVFKFYDFKLYRDQTDHNLLYLSGDSDIVKKHFMMYRVKKHYDKYFGPFAPDTLTPSFHMFCQGIGFIGIGHGQIAQFIANKMADTKLEVNLVKLYFDTPFEKLPPEYQENIEYYDTSTMEKLFECFEIDYQTNHHTDEVTLYKRYYESWWMGVIRNLYFRDDIHTNNCVLLLTGREQIRKTSHFKYLLPSFMREQIAFTTHGFNNENSVRDVCKLSASNLMIVWDELEQYLTSTTESNFKKIIDNNPQKIIDKYQVIPKNIIPIAIYGATSNVREFKLGQEGSRRLFHIPVKWVDTDSLLKTNWHKIINDLRIKVTKAISKDNIPWLLTESELEQQTSLHKNIRSHTGIDIALSEIFDTDVELEEGTTVLPGLSSIQAIKSNKVMTTKDVVDLLVRYDIPMHTLNRPAVVKALERMCGNYTRTRRMTKTFMNPRCTVYKGLASQSGKKKWVVPPIQDHIFKTMFGMFEVG